MHLTPTWHVIVLETNRVEGFSGVPSLMVLRESEGLPLGKLWASKHRSGRGQSSRSQNVLVNGYGLTDPEYEHAVGEQRISSTQ